MGKQTAICLEIDGDTKGLQRKSAEEEKEG